MRSRLCSVLFACVAAAAVAAQQPQPADPSSSQAQPTFRAGANYVRVDMYATDDGRPIEDLKAEEIELREDGVLQKIDAFEHVHVRGGVTPEAVRVEPNSVGDSRQMAADARARVFVIFVDTYNTTVEGSVRIRTSLARFLDRVLGPDDLVAVMAPEMSAADLTFARKTTLLADMLQRNGMWGTKGRLNSTDEREAQYDFCYPPVTPNGSRNTTAAEMKGRRREMLTLDALQDLVVVLGGVREERKAVLTISEGWMQYGPNPQLAAPGRDVSGNTPPPAPQVFGPALRPSGVSDLNSTMAQCEADRLALSMLDDRDRLRQIGERANRANVSFYPVDPRGLVVFDAPIGPDPPPTQQQDARNLATKLDSLRTLADTTDGLAVVNTNMIDKGIDRIVSDLTSYYLLAYYSTNTRLDGKFRSIAVKVTRPRVQVRARRGYRGLTADQILSARTKPASAAEAGDASRPTPLSGVVVDQRAALRIRASSWVAPTSGHAMAARIWLVGELDYRTRKELAWSSGAQAEVAVVAGDGAVVMSKTVDVPAADGTFAIRVPENGSLIPGEYAVRVRLRPVVDTALPVSDVARVQVPAVESPIGEAVLWRRGPSTGVKYLMTADPRFMRTERVRLELPTRTTMPATARLLDRSGRAMSVPVQVSERADAGADFRWIVAEATLAPLAAGDYAIELTADGARQLTQFRIVP